MSFFCHVASQYSSFPFCRAFTAERMGSSSFLCSGGIIAITPISPSIIFLQFVASLESARTRVTSIRTEDATDARPENRSTVKGI